MVFFLMFFLKFWLRLPLEKFGPMDHDLDKKKKNIVVGRDSVLVHPLEHDIKVF